MPSIALVRPLRFALAAALASAALALVGCSAGADDENLGQVELHQDNAPEPTCKDKFECDCEKIGGTVDGPNWCCKHDADGSSTCTNQPDLIIEWLETPPGPKKPPHVQDIPGLKLEMSGFPEPREPQKDPAFAGVCESLKKQADANKGELPDFDPRMSGAPSTEKERFNSAACHSFCDLVANACDVVFCPATDTSCQIHCIHVGMNCDFWCVDQLYASEYPL